MNFKKRSYEPEIMDDLEMEGDQLASTLRQIAMVNKYLGGTQLVLAAIKKILNSKSIVQPIKIIDLGCGGGEILRKIADFGKRKGIQMELIGIDANAFIVDYATKQTKDYPNIKFTQLNIFSPDFEKLNYDIAICSLFLHHFTEEEIESTIRKIKKSASTAFLINDLQRSRIAYFLFNLVTLLLGASHMVRADGLLSIRRAFRRQELKQLMKNTQTSKYTLKWRWAFRYQLIATLQ